MIETRKPKVVITDNRHPAIIHIEKAVLEEGGAEVFVCQCKTEDELIAQCRDAEGMINSRSKITRKVIEALEKCQIIVRHGIGVDTIDVEAATERGILVANVPDYCIEEVSTHALALILACARKVVAGYECVKGGKWDLNLVKPVYRMAGRKAGILGFGRIAKSLAKKVQALGCEALVFDPYVTDEEVRNWGGRKVDWDTFLKEADFISIHTPLTKETRKLLGEKEFRSMKPSAYVINTARGEIIDEKALVKALNEGWIAGAALDVLEKEPVEASNPLLSMNKVILTPHISFYSEESLQELLRKSAQEVVRVLKGQLPNSLVNPQALKKFHARKESKTLNS